MAKLPNAFDHADVFCVALRLRRIGKCPPDVERVFCDVLSSIVQMATALLLKTRKYCRYSRGWFQADVQSMMLLYALQALHSQHLDTADPKRVINYLISTTKNRLRNLAAYAERRKDFNVTFDVDLDAGLQCSDIMGEKRSRQPSAKVTTVYKQ